MGPSLIVKSEISNSSFCQVILAILSVLFCEPRARETLWLFLNQLLKVCCGKN